MATSKLNIFNSLPQHQHSDSEDDDNFTKNKTKKTEKKEDRPAREEKAKDKDVKKVAGATTQPQKVVKEEHARQKDPKKAKGVSDEPHPLDRHSGTNYSSYGAKPKKAGAGKGNWGNNNEKKVGEGEEEKPTEEEGGEEKPKEEEKPGLTLSEYYQTKKLAQNEPQINEAKAKITPEHLLKEMGTATLLKGRTTNQVDDRKVGKKKDRLEDEHRAAITTDHADLLNFRTGFVEKEYKQRERGEGNSPIKPYTKKTGGRKEEENTKEEEPKTQEGQPATENQAPTGEGQGQGQATEGASEGQEKRGGYRGGRGGNRPQQGGDRNQQGGDRNQQGGRRPYQGGKQGGEKAKVNFEDESLFPKLG